MWTWRRPYEPESERGLQQTLPSQPLEGTSPARTLTLDFQPPELQRSDFAFEPCRLQPFVKATKAEDSMARPENDPGEELVGRGEHGQESGCSR